MIDTSDITTREIFETLNTSILTGRNEDYEFVMENVNEAT